MSKIKGKKEKEVKVKEKVQEEVQESQAEKAMEDAAAAPVEEAPKVLYADDYVYEVKAGKTYSGLSSEDVGDFVTAILGKVDNITIKRKGMISNAK
jgi:hypothetical protein